MTPCSKTTIVASLKRFSRANLYSSRGWTRLSGTKRTSLVQSRSRCVCDSRATASAWDDWIAKNPLPGTRHALNDAGIFREPHVASNVASSRRFGWEDTARVLTEAEGLGFALSWDPQVSAWVGRRPDPGGGEVGCKITPPAVVPSPPAGDPSLERFLDTCAEPAAAAAGGGAPGAPPHAKALVVLLSAGAAAMGLWDARGELVRHKVLTGYTVRAKRGGAQLYHEAKGGGARSAGGKLRQRESRRLFSAVAGRMKEWGRDIAACDVLFYSGDVRVRAQAPSPVPHSDPLSPEALRRSSPWSRDHARAPLAALQAWNEVFAAGTGVDRHDRRWRKVGTSCPRLIEGIAEAA
mmetsp:Transcript_8398/g.20136  ORF Transcript_8398/g.20136 Transcript_8398/m.20136 type:complete len:351 (+) Transcript_8398:95-1147(+)